MKKVLLLFLMLFTLPVFGSGIASNTASAPCTNTTLETYSGNSNLQADWAPNTINLRWYNNNTLMDVQTAANTCTYDGALAVPSTAPTRTGYTFDGWTVRPEYDFSTFIEELGMEAWGKTGTGACWYGDRRTGVGYSSRVQCNSGFDDLEYGEWKCSFSYGTIYGMTMCSTTSGSKGSIGRPVESETGVHCWCKVTGYIPAGESVKYAPSNAVPWVYEHELTNCKAGCADWCAWEFGSLMQKRAFGR